MAVPIPCKIDRVSTSRQAVSAASTLALLCNLYVEPLYSLHGLWILIWIPWPAKPAGSTMIWSDWYVMLARSRQKMQNSLEMPGHPFIMGILSTSLCRRVPWSRACGSGGGNRSYLSHQSQDNDRRFSLHVDRVRLRKQWFPGICCEWSLPNEAGMIVLPKIDALRNCGRGDTEVKWGSTLLIAAAQNLSEIHHQNPLS